MSYKVVISKNKITGIEEPFVTGPTDAVPYSLLTDLSNTVYDLSYYIYNDLSLAGTLKLGSYTDNSSSIFPGIKTLLFDASSFIFDESGNVLKLDVVDTCGNIADLSNTVHELSGVVYDLSYYVYNELSNNGTLKVGDISNGIIQNEQDVSAIYFDVDGFDVSFNTNTVTIVNKGGGGGTSDLSALFFNIPLSPFDGSGVLDTSIGSGTIVLNWSNPSQNQAALPFGSYLTYPIGNVAESLVQNDKLPFHKHLHLEYLRYTNGTPDTNWIDISINNTGQTVIPNTINQAYLTSNLGTDVDLCSNSGVAPFNRLYTDQLELGKGYQFRIYLDNSGTNTPVTDPVYGGDVSWNYLYIPDVSGGFISLGSFGVAGPPTALQFNNPQYNQFGISLISTGVADICLNTSFPISSSLPLNYRFGVTISGEINPSTVQMPEHQYVGTFDIDISSNFQKEGTVTFNYNSIGTGVPNSLVGFDISAAPYFNYRLVDYFGINDASIPANPFKAFATGISAETLLPIPSRSDAILTSSYRTPLSTGTIGFSSPTSTIIANAYPKTSSSIISDIWFFNPSTNFTSTATPNLQMANNPGPGGITTGGLIGQDSIDISLSYFKAKVENIGFLYEEDTSNNPTIGYLDVSSSDLNSTRFTITSAANEVGKIPDFQNKGFYTGLNVSDLEIKNMTLANYPDICNNNYNNYTYKLTQFYNDSSSVLNYTESDARTYDFNIGKLPEEDISYTLIGYNNSEATLDNYFFGLRRPNVSSDITIDYSYNLSKLNPDWRKSLTISTNELVYDDPQQGSTIRTVNTSWPSGTNVDIDIEPITTIPINFLKSTQKYNRTYTDTLPQFIVDVEYQNNVLRLPQSTTISQQIAFGSSAKPLWWDFTYETTPSGTSAVDPPAGFFSTTPSSAESSIEFIKAIGFTGWSNDTSYNHTISITDKQLMWTNSKFVGVSDNTSINDYPYFDFSNNFYNPNGELLDYSIYNTMGLSGESFSQTYTASPASNNFWNQNQGGMAVVNRVLKYITFNIDCPFRDDFQNYNSGTSQDFIYQLTLNSGGIDHDTSVTSSSDGYWVFHNEKNTTEVTFGPFDGQKLWTTLTGTTPGSGSYVQNTGTSNDGYKIAFPSQTTGRKSVLQISIGLPSDLVESISSVNITFKAV